MTDKSPDDELIENIKIISTDDEKIKSFGEIFTSDSSRKILQLLFNEELSATGIAQKSDVSLQLVKYHLNKLQDLGVVKISKIEKNSKSQDMKIYSASKFSIVIVPPNLSEKTKESKLLVRSFRHIYKVAGLGIATGFSGLFSFSQIRQDPQIPVTNLSDRGISSVDEYGQQLESSKFFAGEESALMADESNLQMDSDVFSKELDEVSLDVIDVTMSSGELITTTSDLFIPLMITTLILGGLTIYYLYKFFKKSN